VNFDTVKRLALGVWALTVMVIGSTLYLAFLNDPSSFSMVLESLLILSFSTVGALISSRRPGNAIGWLFCLGALVWIFGELALEYGVYALVTVPGSLPAGAWAAWFGTWARGIGWFMIVAFLLLLFPDGRLPSPRWRPVMWASTGYIVVFTFAVWLSPVSNDFRLTAVRNPLAPDLQFMTSLLDVANMAAPLLLLAGGAAVISRFRKAQGDERQQIKWFAYAITVMVIVFTFWFLLILAGLLAMGSLLFVVPLLGIPVAAGVAILKYRLYDIDVVINLTLVYGVLTVLLGLAYFGSVVVLQYVLRALTGEGSQLAVVASTLAIAALFNPLRRRVQGIVDRRFYRKKYNAAKALEDFSIRLRDETDLDQLGGEMVTVVRETVQPAHVSMWLRVPRYRVPDSLSEPEES